MAPQRYLSLHRARALANPVGTAGVRPLSHPGTATPGPAMIHISETLGKRPFPTVGCMDVALVRWPAGADQLERLREQRSPRLLVVAENAPPPSPIDELEDWVRTPVDQGDIRARVATLAQRAERLLVPSIDTDDVVHFDGALAPLSPVEARLARPLVAAFRTVVSRSDLARAAWDGDDPGRNALDVHVSRLRRRLEASGLRIRTVRSRGYLLETG